jgi:hypothetical protein
MEFKVEDALRGDVLSGDRVLISQVGRVEAPLMKPGVTYLLFLERFPEEPNVFFVSGGEFSGRYIVDDKGVIRSKVGDESPYTGAGWQMGLLGQRLDEVRPRLR